MKKLISIVLFMVFVGVNSAHAAFWNKSNKQTPPAPQSQTSVQPAQPQTQNQTQSQEPTEVSYPDDVDDTPIDEDEIDLNADPEQMYRDMPVPSFKYMHDVDPGEYQDIRYSTWSPYPLFRLTAPLFFKTITIQPGYYLLTPREHEGAWFMLFKEAGKVKYIIPCYKKEMVPFGFYQNNLPQIKLTTTQKIREKTLQFIGKHFNSAQRHDVTDTFLEAEDLDNNFISIIVYWGNYRYYMVLRSIQL